MPDQPRRLDLRTIDVLVSEAFRPGAKVLTTLRWRIKQIQRQDWPATLEEDPHLKRGYTARQFLRLLAALALIEADQGPTEAVRLARENESAILAIMRSGVTPHPNGEAPLLAALAARSLSGADETSRKILPQLRDWRPGLEDGATVAWVILDFAALAARALMRLTKAQPDRDHSDFHEVLEEGARLTLRGLGHVPSSHPSGDRYASRTRSKGTER